MPSKSVQYRYTHQFSPISLKYANPLIHNYFYLLKPTLSFVTLPYTNTVNRQLKIPHRKRRTASTPLPLLA